MTDMTNLTLPRTIPTPPLTPWQEQQRAKRAERDRVRDEKVRRAEGLEQAARESLHRPTKTPTAPIQPRQRTRPTRAATTAREPSLRPCAGTCGRTTRARGTRAKNAPGTVSRVRDGYCFTCYPGADNPTGIRPCTGPCGRPTRTRGTVAIPGTVARVHDGMCATCVRGKPVRPETDTTALLGDYRAGMSIEALKAKHHIGKSTIYVLLESVGEPRRRKAGRAA